MKILMTADTIGGVFTYAIELIRALERHGVQVALATFGRRLSLAQRAQLETSGVHEVFESDFALEWMPEPWRDIERSEDWLRGVVSRARPDCIHFNHYGHAGLDWGVPTLVVAHSCVWSWWQAVHGTAPGSDFARYYQCVRAAIHRASRVVAPSADMLASVVRNYGRPEARASVIPNGIDLGAYAPRPKLPVIFAAGRLWDAAKNVQALEQIAPELAWPICVAGETVPPAAGSGGDAASARPRTACHMFGALPRAAVARCLGRAAIYAHPARYEPFGLSVLEAAASGCALVLGAVPSLLETWAGAADFVDPDDPRALLAALKRTITDRAHREHMATQARARASELSAERMGTHYLELYGELTAAGAARSIACAS